MKKHDSRRSLRLSTETVRNLTADQLRLADGGSGITSGDSCETFGCRGTHTPTCVAHTM
jgi:hypothetical protein